MSGKGKIAPREFHSQQHPDSDEESVESVTRRQIGEKAPREASNAGASKRARHGDDASEELNSNSNGTDSEEESGEESGSEEESGGESAGESAGESGGESVAPPADDSADDSAQAAPADSSGMAGHVAAMEVSGSEAASSHRSGNGSSDSDSAGSEDASKLRALLQRSRDECKRLAESEAALKLEILRLRKRCGETRSDNGTQSGNSTAILPSPQRALTGPPAMNFSLALLMPQGFEHTPVPYAFKQKSHGFPHAVQASKTGAREYVVEARLWTKLSCLLVKRSGGRAVECTEELLPTTRQIRYKVEVCFVNTNEVVKPSDLKTPPSMPTADETATVEARMFHGKVEFKFHTKFLSIKTKNPSGQSFFFRISCLNPELERYAISAVSVPFVVVSRQSKPKPEQQRQLVELPQEPPQPPQPPALPVLDGS